MAQRFVEFRSKKFPDRVSRAPIPEWISDEDAIGLSQTMWVQFLESKGYKNQKTIQRYMDSFETTVVGR